MTLILKLMSFICKMKYGLDLNHPIPLSSGTITQSCTKEHKKPQRKSLREALCILCVSLCHSLKRAESLVKWGVRVVVLRQENQNDNAGF